MDHIQQLDWSDKQILFYYNNEFRRVNILLKMSKIICVETTTNVCSVALAIDGKCVSLREVSDPKAHSSQLSLQIESLCDENKIKLNDLDAISISMGPGSYTGLRIGTSLIKGILYSIGKPLIAVDTLQAMAKGVIATNQLSAGAKLCPMIDARRMEVYNAFYDSNAQPLAEVVATVVDENSFATELSEAEVYFFGNGAEKCKSVLTSNNAKFIDGVECSARWMCDLSEEKFKNNDFADLAYFEPFYLKEFQATTPKKNLL